MGFYIQQKRRVNSAVVGFLLHQNSIKMKRRLLVGGNLVERRIRRSISCSLLQNNLILMDLLDGMLSGTINTLESFMHLFGYSLAHPIQFILRIALLYMAGMNIIGFILRFLNFAYWRLFERFKYLVMLGALVVHLSYTLGDLGEGIPAKAVALLCTIVVLSYLADFAWVVGEQYVKNKTTINNGLLQALLIGPFILIGAAWFFLLRGHDIDFRFYLYLFALLMLMFFRRNGSIITSGFIVLFSMIQKYIQVSGYTHLAIVLQIILLYIVLDREGKETGVQRLKDDYPPKTYIFFACLELYIYFLLDPEPIPLHSYLLGAIYVVEAIFL